MYRIVFLLDYVQKLVNALRIRDIKSLEMYRGLRMGSLDLSPGLLSQLEVADGHNDVPPLFAGQIFDYALAYALV
jgi:hypothetical protein